MRLFGDQFGGIHAIGQYGPTQKLTLTSNSPITVTLDSFSIYRIVATDDIHVKQSNNSNVQANLDDCILFIEHDDYFHTSDGYIYLSIISANNCDVYITKVG